MSIPLIVAFDLSLDHTGFAINADVLEHRPTAMYDTRMGVSFGVLEPPTQKVRLSTLERIHWVREQVLLLSKNANLVVLEGLAFGARGNAILDLAGLAYVIRFALRDMDIPWVDIQPNTLKKYATGGGQGDKAAMLAAAIRKLDYPGSDFDEVDALWLLQTALVYYGLPGAVSTPTQVQRAQLEIIKWPIQREAFANV